MLVLAEVTRRQVAHAEAKQSLPAGAGRPALDDAKQGHGAFAPLLGLPEDHDGVVVTGSRRGSGLFVQLDILRIVTVRAGAVAAREQK